MTRIWHDLERYRTGRTLEGNDLFSIPLPPDDEGMVGRECPQDDCQPRYFKISASAKEETAQGQEEKETVEYLYCPYCGHKDGSNQFTTRDQIEWVKSMMVRDIHKTFDEMLRDVFGSQGTTYRGGFLSIRLEYRPGMLPSVRHYAEKELKRIVECDQCGRKYAVYGIAMYCPRCGEGNLEVHLKRSVEIIRSLMGAHDQIIDKAGKEAGYHLLGNCLEDCVSLFEGFLKVIYANRLRERCDAKEYSRKIAQLHNSFQNLSKARQIFQEDLNIDILSGISQEDLNFMELQFAKRHVITHNLGLVDEKFRKQASSWQTTGQDVGLDASDIEKLLNLIEEVFKHVMHSC